MQMQHDSTNMQANMQVSLVTSMCQVFVCPITLQALRCFYTPLGASPDWGRDIQEGTLSSDPVAASLKRE